MDPRTTNPPLAQTLEHLRETVSRPEAGKLPPAELWSPPTCGDIGLRIARDGTWLHQDVPIRRPALTRLFSTILRRDPDRYVLVTPVEMVIVEVEDAPFVAVELILEKAELGPKLAFRTNVDDWVTADQDHPIRFEKDAHDGVKPYIKVRGGLWALASRPLLYDLVALGEIRHIDGEAAFGVASAGVFFRMGAAADIEDLG